MQPASSSNTASSSRWARSRVSRCARMSIAAGPDCWRSSSSGSRRRDTDAAQFPCNVNLDLTAQERSMTELYVFPPSPRAFKVMALANYLGIEPTLHMLDLIKGEQKSPQYAALNPNMRMPTLKEGDYVLWESSAIAQYLAAKKPESGLLPQAERRRLDVMRWQFWEHAHWDPACAGVAFEYVAKPIVLGINEPDMIAIAKGTEAFHRAANVLDGHLENKRFVTGDTLTLADFGIGSAVLHVHID